MRKKEKIYVTSQISISIGALTWVQMAYNDPSIVKAWDWKEWAVMLAISAVFVTASTMTTWLSYLSEPPQKAPKPQIQIPTDSEPTGTTTEPKDTP